MENKNSILSEELIETLKNARDEKIYGSVEIYFEKGDVTQITQRTIKKLGNSQKSLQKTVKKEKMSNVLTTA